MRRKFILIVLLIVSCPFLPIFAKGHEQLCVQTHFGRGERVSRRSFEAIADLGVGWIRDDLFWSEVETEKGCYKIPDHVREWVDGAGKHGLKVLLTLNGGNTCYANPFDQDGAVRFARFVARELRGRVQAIELIHEPCNEYRRVLGELSGTVGAWNGWNPQTGKIDEWAKSYLKTMNAMADAIHDESPGEYEIIGLGCCPPLNARLLKLGVSPHVRGMGMQPYPYLLVPELQPYGDTLAFRQRDGIVVGDRAGTFTSIKQALSTLSAANKGPGELWVVGLGRTCDSRDIPRNYGGFNEVAQAKYAQRHLLECLGTGVRLASWYDFCDQTESPENKLGDFGIVRCDGTPKPAYHAIRRVAQTMVGWQARDWGDVRVHFRKFRRDPRPLVWDGSLRETYGTPRAYTFGSEDGKRRAVALWSSERAGEDRQPRGADVTITSDRIAESIQALDMMTGQRSEVPFSQRGSLIRIDWLTVPDHPVLLFLAGTAPATAPEIKAEDIFSKGEDWRLERARETRSKWTTNGDCGTMSFEVGDEKLGFTIARRELAIPEACRWLSFRARSSARVTILVRLYDATGQTHQFKLPTVPSHQWECFWVDFGKGRKQSWGGAGDRKIHYPLRGLGLGLENLVLTTGHMQEKDFQGAVDYKDLQLLPK